MLKLFISESIPGVRRVPFLFPSDAAGKRLFQQVPAEAYDGLYERVEAPKDADLIALPHEYVDLRKHPEYLAAERNRATKTGKTVLISAYQDASDPIDIPRAVILRPSLMRSRKLPNEICMPAYVEDLGSIHGVTLSPKGEQLSVGFMGKAGFSNAREHVRYLLRNYLLRHGPDREGMYFRRHALQKLAGEPRIALSATARKRYSAHQSSIELPPDVAREQFVASIRDSLCTLAPRGDGNYSLRFYEALALGRIPILIDTDMVLPLEDQIIYDKFIIRIPFQKLPELPELLLAWYDSHSDEEIRSMQEKARDVFVAKLYMPAFLRTFFSEILPAYL
jgi:hypothetical protein